MGATRLRVRRDADPVCAAQPPLLLLNGVGATLEMWQPLRRHLRMRPTIAFDLPGLGQSPPQTVPVRMRGLARLVAELIAGLGHERVDVLGYSFGGVVAQELARRHPERVRRLVLCATIPGWPTMPGDPVAWSLMLTPARYYNRQLAELIVPRIAGGRTARDSRVRHANLRRRLSHPPSLRGYTHQLYALSGWTSHPWLHHLSMPTLVIQGDADPLVATANARWLAWRIPEAELHLVEGAGHLLLMDEPARVAPIIDAFLRR